MTPAPDAGRRSLFYRFKLSRIARGRLLLLPALLTAAVGTAIAGTRTAGDAPRASVDRMADTVSVFGPRRFEAGRGRAALHMERFAATADAAYVLRVVDGDGRGNGRVSALSLRMNGAVVATTASLRGAGGTLDVPVMLLAQNTVEASVEGDAGAGVSVVVLQVPEPSFTAFGPRTVRRAAGAPVTDTESFALPAGAAAPYRLHVINGAADGSARTSSAVIRVNGVQGMGPADLSQNVAALLRDVPLQARNTVEVELRGAPGSQLTYRITAMDSAAPRITIAAPAADLVTRLAQVDVAGTVEDATPVKVTVNGAAAARSGTGFSATVPLTAEGANSLVISATDAAGNRTDSVRTVTRDTEAPVVTIVSPAEGEAVKDTVVEVRGTLSDRTRVEANVNGVKVTPDASGAFTVRVPIVEGTNFLTLSATDAAGNAASAVRQVLLDTRAPELAITAPTDGLATRDSSIVVTGTAKDASALTVRVNDVAAAVDAAGGFRAEVALATDGPAVLRVVATDAAGNASQAERRIVRDTQAPAVTLAAPAEGMVTRDSAVVLAGRVEDATAVTLTLGGAPVTVAADGAFTASAALAADGPAALALVATDAAGNRTELVRNVIRDTQAPTLQLASPTDGAVVKDEAAAVTGRVADATTVSVAVNGAPATLGADGGFQATVALAEGETTVIITATDAAGNEARSAVRVVRDSQVPVITIASPAEGSTTEDEHTTLTGTLRDANTVTLTLNGAPVAVSAEGSFSVERPLVPGPNAFTFEARDAAGNTATATRSVTREENDTGLPPDPSRVASAIDPTVATSLGVSSAFLYSGPTPIQTGVAPGTVVPYRTAVLRGRVLTREGAPLSGVRVTVRGHPEYGQTVSRRDGAYDLVVNGGAMAVLDFDKEGWLPAQRAIGTVWLEFANLDDVALVPLDSRVTGVALTAGTTEAQVARGSIVSDADGPRQATVLFSPGTEAYLEMADGSRRPVPSLSIRLTEYTVGAGGRAAMPGELPGTSGYTYAVEVSADEAIAAGAGHTRFTKPVKFYVDNFLEFPAGLTVPVASYDRDRAAWIPMDNGRVIRVLPGGGALASVDVTGDGAADGDAALAALGIDATERAELARTYPEGASLWRMQTTHLTPFDLNYPAGPNPRPRGGQRPRRRPPPEECSGRRSGSIIECESRVLGEQIAVTGTPLTLNYRSDRVLGRGNETVIPLTPDSLDNMVRVGVEVFVAGRRFYQEYPAAPRLSHTFRWDGLDAYGRRPQGQQTVRVRRTYTYPNYYLIPAEDARSFGLACSLPRQGDRGGMLPCIVPTTINERARAETTEADEFTFEVNQWDSRQGSVAGWSLSEHHVYDPTSRRLYMGTGERRTASRMGAAIETIGGNGQSGYLAQNGDARSVPLDGAGPIAVAPDGTVYVAGWENFWLARITREGRVEHVAGGNRVRCTVAPCGDGGPLSGVRFAYGIEDLKFGPDGSLYIADGKLIRKLAPDGKTSLVAGNYVLNLNETYVHRDGGPAATTPIGYSWGVDVGPDGSVYFVESGNRVPVTRVRKVSPDGTIHTVAGGTAYPRNETAACRAEGIAATAACLDFATDVEVAPDGTVYVLEPYNRMVKVTPQGTLVRVAGRRDLACWGTEDGIPALETGLCGWRMELHRDGRIFIDDEEGPTFYTDSISRTGRIDGRARMRVIGLDGIVTTAFGGQGYCSSFSFQQCGDNGLARSARIGSIPGLAFGPDGAMYLGDIDADRVRRVGLPFPGYDESTTFIASDDGAQVYELDGAGRHVRTRHARTGAVLRTFGYDGAGRITSMADENGETTRVERDGAGRVQALVAPGGERTALRENADGYLAAVVNPAGEQVRVDYGGAGGLMTGLTDGAGGAHGYAYDGLGRLERDTDAAGGFQAAAGFTDRNCTAPGECDEGSGTRVSTAAGRTTTYWSQRLDRGAILREVASPTGLVTRMSSDDFGFNVLTSPDGMRTSSLLAHDPRFGMDAPYASRAEIRTPGGLRLATTGSRRVVRGNPADPFSITTQVDSLVANGRATVTTYEAAAHRTTVATPAGRRTAFVSDSLGRVVEVRPAGGLPIRVQLDAQGRMGEVRQGDRGWGYGYDARGRLQTVRHLLGTTTLKYDSANRVVASVHPGQREVGYVYDAAGNWRGVRPAGRQLHTFGVDSAGRLTAYTPPAVDGVTSETRYRYTAEGQIERVLRAEGDEVVYEYDAEGRTQEVAFSGTRVRYGYDPVTGQLRSATSAERGSLAFGYDGSLLTSTTWSGAVAGSVSQAFNNDFRVALQRVNGAHEVDFRYDADGLLTGVGALTLTRAPDSGRLTATQAGGVSTSLAYDSLGQVVGLASRFGTQALYEAGYRRDAAGRLEALSEKFGADSAVYRFGYDEAGRLATVHRDGVAQAAYEYDANGNRLRALTAAGALEAEYDEQDRLRRLGDARFGYTAGGDLAFRAVGADTTRYTYDAFGNLTRVALPAGTRVEYLVDASNRRVGKRVDGALVQGFLYGRGVNPVAELDGQGQVVSRFVYGARPNVPDLMIRNGVTYRVVADQAGSVRAVVNTATGEVVQRIDYDPYGTVIRDSRPGFQPFGFAGGLSDGQVGLVRFGARDYDPRAGRWVTRDPLRFLGGDGNLYAYVRGDPVNLVDPTGNIPFLAVPAALWAGAELGLTAADVAETVGTLRDPCASGWDQARSVGLTAAGVVLPGAGYNKVDDAVALRGLVNEATNRGRTPLSADDANTILDWAQEINYPGMRASASDLASPSNWTANPVPHIHIPGAGRHGHVPVAPGVRPRT